MKTKTKRTNTQKLALKFAPTTQALEPTARMTTAAAEARPGNPSHKTTH